MFRRQGKTPSRLSHHGVTSRRPPEHRRLDLRAWDQAFRVSPADRDRIPPRAGDVDGATPLRGAQASGKLRIGMLGLYGMTMPKLHFTGFETGFGESAPRLAEMGHDVVMYCRRGSFPVEMRVPEYKGVRLVYVPSPGGKNFSGVIATFFAVLHALAFGRFQIF